MNQNGIFTKVIYSGIIAINTWLCFLLLAFFTIPFSISVSEFLFNISNIINQNIFPFFVIILGILFILQYFKEESVKCKVQREWDKLVKILKKAGKWHETQYEIKKRKIKKQEK